MNKTGAAGEGICHAYFLSCGVSTGGLTGLMLHDMLTEHWHKTTGKDWTDLKHQQGLRHAIRIWAMQKHEEYVTSKFEGAYLLVLVWRATREMVLLIEQTRTALGQVTQPMHLSLMASAVDAYRRVNFPFSAGQARESVCTRLKDVCSKSGLRVTQGFLMDHRLPPCYEWVDRTNRDEVIKNGTGVYLVKNHTAWVQLRKSGELIVDGQTDPIKLKRPPAWYNSEFRRGYAAVNGAANRSTVNGRGPAKDTIKKAKMLLIAMGERSTTLDSLTLL